MKIGTLCSRNVCVSRLGAALADAVESMSKHHVGAIVVLDRGRPVGIVTDRDVVCAQLDPPRDLFCMAVEDAMTSDVLTLNESCEIADAVAAMSKRGVRRAPVVDEAGSLVGIVSMGDLLSALAGDLSLLAGLIKAQPAHEA